MSGLSEYFAEWGMDEGADPVRHSWVWCRYEGRNWHNCFALLVFYLGAKRAIYLN